MDKANVGFAFALEIDEGDVDFSKVDSKQILQALREQAAKLIEHRL